jgi:hypothetical protein
MRAARPRRESRQLLFLERVRQGRRVRYTGAAGEARRTRHAAPVALSAPSAPSCTRRCSCARPRLREQRATDYCDSPCRPPTRAGRGSFTDALAPYLTRPTVKHDPARVDDVQRSSDEAGLIDIVLGHCRIPGRLSGNPFGGRDDLGVTGYRRALDGSGVVPGVREREVTVAQHGGRTKRAVQPRTLPRGRETMDIQRHLKTKISRHGQTAKRATCPRFRSGPPKWS